MKKINKVFLFLSIGLVLSSCSNDNTQEGTAAKLLFKSGFEKDVYIDTEVIAGSEDYAFLRGKDNETEFNWPIDILGSSESALHFLDDDGDALEARLERVTGHNGTQTTTLYNKMNYNVTGSTQLPYEILDVKESQKDIYIRYWMKIDDNMVGQPDKWRALFEYKTKDYKDPGENGTGFRLISYIYTDEVGHASWHFQGDEDSRNSIWECDTLTPTQACNNSNVPVITNKWFLSEYYWHWSNGDDGLAWWKIDGKTVGEHHGATTRENNPIDFIMLTQIYGDSNPKEQWIDDIEIWEGLPEKYEDSQ